MSIKIPQIKKTSLRSPLDASGTTIKVRKWVDTDGNTVALSDFGDWFSVVLKAGDVSEIIKCDGFTENADGTADLDIATNGRSISPTSPYTGGATGEDFQTADVIFTNDALTMSKVAIIENDQTWTGEQTFTETARPLLDNDQDTAINEALVTFGQLTRSFASGAPDGGEATKGLYEAATTVEVANGDDSGSTTAPTVVRPSKLAEVIQNGSYLYAVEDGTGSDDTYTITLVPTPTGTLPDGAVIYVKLTVANAGACTLNPNGQGAGAIKKYVNGAVGDLETGDIVANMPAIFVKQGSTFVMMNPGATMPTTAILTEMAAFFASTKVQGLKTTFTAGEDIAANDLVSITAADTVKRHAPTALPSSFTSASQAATLVYNNNCRTGHYLQLSSSLDAFIYNDAASGSDQMKCIRIPKTASTGAIGTISNDYGLTTAITSPETIDAVVMDSSRVLVCSSKSNSFSGGVIDLTSAVTTGTTVAIDTSNVSEGFCEYISDSHVLFFARNTTGSSIDFYKYTVSGTTPTLASTGTVITLAGKTFVLKGVRRFGTSDYFLFIIQNDTDATAQAIIAHYNTGTSTFDVVGTPTNFTGNQQLYNVSRSTAVFAKCSDTQMIVSCPTSNTAGIYFLIYRADATSTTPQFSAFTATATSGTAAGYTLTKANARCAFLNTQNGTTATSRLLEINTDGTGLTSRAVLTTTSGPTTGTLESNAITASFHANPTTMGMLGFLGTTDDPYIGIGAYTLPNPVGLSAAITSAAAGVVDTNGYSSKISGLTAGTKYYADIGGLLTTDSNGTPDKVGIAKDAAEIIIKSW